MMETISCQLCSLILPNLQIYISHLKQVHSKDPNFSPFVYLKVALIISSHLVLLTVMFIERTEGIGSGYSQ